MKIPAKLAFCLFLPSFMALAIFSFTQPVFAANPTNADFDTCSGAQLGAKDSGCQQVSNCPTYQNNAFNPSGDCLTALPKVHSNNTQLNNGLKLVFGVTAGIALISLSIAAFNYATVATDPDKISRAKQTIVLSLIGLIIALSAEVIVITVISKI